MRERQTGNQIQKLALEEIIALDKVQKGKKLSNQEEKHLRAQEIKIPV